MKDLDPEELRRWAAGVEARLGALDAKTDAARPLSSAEVLGRIKHKQLQDIKTRTQLDTRFLDKSWRPLERSCDCGHNHNAIKIDGQVLCPIKYYLILGRLALFGLTETPSKELYDALITRSIE